jgi:plastocyanin
MKTLLPKLFFFALLFLGMIHSAVGATTNVSFGTTFFNPQVVNIKVGDMVVWSSTGGSHTVTGTGPTEAMCGPSVTAGCTKTFNTAGSFPYVCTVSGHAAAGMTGMVVVASAAAPPTVSITSPANNTVFSAGPANITLQASASGNGGATVTNVQYFSNVTNAIGSNTASPYLVVFNNVSPGTYALTAKAKDNNNLATTSSIVNVTVNNTAPSVSITNPAANAVFASPAQFTVFASASDFDGSVTNVQFFVDGSSIGNDTTANPYSAITSSLAAGSHALVAVASDNLGAKKTNSISITANARPTMTFNVSAPQPVNENSTLNFTVTANDTDGPSLTLNAGQLPSGATFTGTSGPKVFAWTPNYGASDNSPYLATFIANDGVNADVSTSMVINVNFVFTPVNISNATLASGKMQFDMSGLRVGRTNFIQGSTDLASSNNWIALQTNVAAATATNVVGLDATNAGFRFYRVLEVR